MGNEFGHPEWIDFPREGNGWSYHYCRRQWSLAENGLLRYMGLNIFDRDMVHLLKRERIMNKPSHNLWVHDGDKVIAFSKGKNIFVFNFHPKKSFEGYFIPILEEGEYQVTLSTDNGVYGGFDRIDTLYKYNTEALPDGRIGFKFYLPSRTGVVFKKL
jgi:1,4-alpha-glucan branching enzyme